MANIWFGNTYQADYVPAPVSGLEAGGVGYSSSVQLQNGGAFVVNSRATHREFPMEWALNDFADLEFITSHYSGVYGNEYLYWVDPFATNALPPHWAAPALSSEDWPSLTYPGDRPSTTLTPVNSFAYPQYGAVYSPSGAVGYVPDRQLTLLIPKFQTIHIGFAGVSDGAVIRVVPTRHDGTPGEAVDLEMRNVNSNELYEVSFSGQLYKYVSVYITPTRVGGTVVIYGGQAVYTTGGYPEFQKRFQPGTGHTGLVFTEAPTVTYIQARRNRKLVKASASFTEVEAWQ